MNASGEQFLSHVAAHAGISEGRARHVIRVVLSGLGSYLTGGMRDLVADELPPELREAFLAGDGRALPIEERLAEPGMTAGTARELFASVCYVLVEELSNEAIAAVRRSVPAGIERLFAATDPERIASEATHKRHDTLASGRPGSHHPIGDAPGSRVHDDSVATSNPHGATKLSSSPGMTQQRRHETLAEGQPGNDEPLASGRE